jgi:hypothetical protein
MLSRVRSAKISINEKPQACAKATTRKTLARLAAIPPAKSAAPHTAAAPRLSPAARKLPEFMVLTIHGGEKTMEHN